MFNLKLRLRETIFAIGLIAASAAPAFADNIVQFGQIGTMPDLNPFNLSNPHAAMQNTLYDVLVRYDSKLEPQPRLAESWSFSEDAKTMTLKLRSGVKFHSGKEFTSADVKFTFDYVMDKSHGALILPFAARVASVETPDPLTVVLTFKSAFPAVFDLLDLLYIVDSDTAGDFSKTANGTGPFSLVEHQPGNMTKFAAFDGYWAGRPSVDGVEIVVSSNRQSEMLALKGGDLDLVSDIGWIDALPFSRDDEFVVGNAPSGTALDLSFNLRTNADLQNPAVREAIDLSLDRARIAKLLFGETGRTWCLPYDTNSLAYVAEFDNCAFDIEKAKKVLADAGVKTPIELSILASSEMRPEMLTVAEVLQANLKDVGINLSIKNVDATGYRSMYVEKKEFELAAHVFGRTGKDPSSMLESTVVWQPVNNITGYENDAYKAAVEAGGSTTDRDARLAEYAKVASLIRSDRFIVPIVPIVRIFVTSKHIEGMEWSADGFPIFEKIKISNP